MKEENKNIGKICEKGRGEKIKEEDGRKNYGNKENK
jgi:hypothetical protein